MHPFTNLEGLTGVFVTGEKPQWIVGDEKYVVRSYGLKQAAFTFGRTTHLGGKGEYFIRIEDVSSNGELESRIPADASIGHIYLLFAPRTQYGFRHTL